MGVGLFLVGAGLIFMHGIEVGDSWTVLLPGFLLAGAGVGMTNPGIASVAIGVVDPARAGMASGINSTFRQVGIATGVAALGAIFQSSVDSKLHDLIPQAPDGFSDAVSSGATPSALASIPAQFRDQAAAAADQAFVSGLNEILLIGAGDHDHRRARELAAGQQKDMVAFAGAPPAEPAPEPSAEPIRAT